MNRDVNDTPSDSLADGQATIEASVPLLAKDGRRCANMELVEGSGPGMSCETQQLLRHRLRLAALILFAVFAVFFVWSWFSLDYSQTIHWVMLVSHLAITLLLGACGAMLCRSCTITTRLLRLKELLIFGLPSAYFLLIQYVKMTECASEGYLPSPVGSWLMLIFIYALFIPNTWTRAAGVIATIAVAPVLMTLFLWSQDAACTKVLSQNTSFVSQLTLMMLIGSLVAVAGVHTIGSLRREAFEARQLGQYKLRQRIGSGGMGEVYLAEHQLMKRPCAVKIIRPEKAGDPQVLARFEREVQTTAKLSHWNNIDIFDYGHTEDGTFYYVMEYLPGLNFHDLVQQHGPCRPSG